MIRHVHRALKNEIFDDAHHRAISSGWFSMPPKESSPSSSRDRREACRTRGVKSIVAYAKDGLQRGRERATRSCSAIRKVLKYFFEFCLFDQLVFPAAAAAAAGFDAKTAAFGQSTRTVRASIAHIKSTVNAGKRF